MGMGFAPTWLRQVSPPPLLHKTTLTTDIALSISNKRKLDVAWNSCFGKFLMPACAKVPSHFYFSAILCPCHCLWIEGKFFSYKNQLPFAILFGYVIMTFRNYNIHLFDIADVVFTFGFSLTSLFCRLSGLMRGLATLPQRWIQEPSVVRDRDGRPPRGPPGSALLLCVRRECTAGRSPWGKQIQGTWPSVGPVDLSYGIFLCVFIVYRRVVRILCLLLYSAICWCVFVALV